MTTCGLHMLFSYFFLQPVEVEVPMGKIWLQ